MVSLHAAFVVYVVFGGLLAWRCRACPWLHLPAVLWAAFVEFSGTVCPLTPLENWLRTKAGARAYNADFIEHYLTALLYPAHLTRTLQVILGIGVLTVNLAIYGWLIMRRRR